MAFIQMNMFSESLMRTVPVNVILPVDKVLAPGEKGRGDRPYKTLYLLHGIFGNYPDWVVGTRIQRYANEKDLVVIMPSGENSFYVDQPKGHNYYGQYVGQELVEVTRRMFPLSRDREDTFIGGLSMGGYGAVRNGLKYHDTFGYIVCLSGALETEHMPTRTNDETVFFRRRDYAESCFGDLNQLIGSDKDPKALVNQILEQKGQMPKFYVACGDRDVLLPDSQDFVDFLKEKDVDVTFEVGPGDHEWDFWDTYIKKAIAWLPTDDKSMGIDSGNVGI